MRHFMKFMIALSLLLGANVASAAQLAKHLTLNNCADNQLCVARVQYDFAVDGGAVGSLDVATAGQGIVIIQIWTKSLTTPVGAGATFKMGITGTLDKFLPTGPAVDLVAGDTFVGDITSRPYYLASPNKIIQTIGTNPLTAGKLEYAILYFKP